MYRLTVIIIYSNQISHLLSSEAKQGAYFFVSNLFKEIISSATDMPNHDRNIGHNLINSQ